MFGSSSSVSVFSYSIPAFRRSKKVSFFTEAINNIFQILAEQNRLKYTLGAVPLTHSGKALLSVASAIKKMQALSLFANSSPFPFPIPIGDLLNVCEDFITHQAGPITTNSSNKIFLSFCGLSTSFNFSLVHLQSYLRHLIYVESKLSSFKNHVFRSMSDPLLVIKEDFFSHILENCATCEISFFKDHFSNIESIFEMGIDEANLNGPRSLCFLFYNFHLALYSFLSSVAVENSFINDFCVRISKRLSDFVMSCLDSFYQPGLVSCLVWEYFRFSGLFLESFHTETQGRHFRNHIVFFTIGRNKSKSSWIFPVVEKHLRSQLTNKTEAQACELFLSAYNNNGRNENFPWPHRPFTEHLPSHIQLIQEAFSYWMTACKKRCLYITQTSSQLQISLSSSFDCLWNPYSLSSMAAIFCLESSLYLSDVQRISILDSAFTVSETDNPKMKLHCHLRALTIFYRYSSCLAAERCMLSKIHSLKGHMSACHLNEARSCLFSLLQIIPYCEHAHSSFCLMQVIIKQILSALNCLKSPKLSESSREERHCTQRYISSYDLVSKIFISFMCMKSYSSCGSLNISLSPHFCLSLINLFLPQDDADRIRRLESLYD